MAGGEKNIAIRYGRGNNRENDVKSTNLSTVHKAQLAVHRVSKLFLLPTLYFGGEILKLQFVLALILTLSFNSNGIKNRYELSTILQ